ncbi:hypothetical protein [Bartonella sp. TT119HLJHH]|uniref:hypothetical protein n=1 Tax=Bartonella sp. TT119HLJHH TaxID=3243579 RepID=UPI0035CE9C96
MAIVTKGVFTDIDDMLMNPLTDAMGNATTHHYCALAAQLKELCTLYNIFMATLCLSSQFIITGYKNR